MVQLTGSLFTSAYMLCILFQISFIGEAGCDGGGLTREFFTIFAKRMAEKYLDGGVFRHDALAVQVEPFKTICVNSTCMPLNSASTPEINIGVCYFLRIMCSFGWASL